MNEKMYAVVVRRDETGEPYSYITNNNAEKRDEFCRILPDRTFEQAQELHNRLIIDFMYKGDLYDRYCYGNKAIPIQQQTQELGHNYSMSPTEQQYTSVQQNAPKQQSAPVQQNAPLKDGIIGNVSFKMIPSDSRSYIKTDRQTIEKLAARLTAEKIKFSGQLRSSGDSTITVNRSDLQKAEALASEVNPRYKSKNIKPKLEYSDILTRFQNVQHLSGNQHRANCPCCNDQKQHLFINHDEKEEKILLECKKGCKVQEITAAVGLQMSDLFTSQEQAFIKPRTSFRQIPPTLNQDNEYIVNKPNAENNIENKNNDFSPEKPQISPIVNWRNHVYYNDDGSVFGRKSIGERENPNDDKLPVWWRKENGKDIKGLNGLKPPIYNLPAVIKSEKIYIVEGEKDAETLIKMGLCATTPPHGGSSHWRTEDNKYFAGKDVVILSDNDTVGLKKGAEIYNALSPIAANVKHIPAEQLAEIANYTPTMEINGVREVKKGYDITDIANGIGLQNARNVLFYAEKKEIIFEKQEPQKITQQDIAALKTAVPPRTSVLNFNDTQVQQTQKFQNKLNAELNEKSPYDRRNEDWREWENEPVKVIAVEDKGADFKSVRESVKDGTIDRPIVTNADTNWNIQISRIGLEDSVKWAIAHNDKCTLNALYNAPQILQNAVCLDTVTSENDNKNKANNSLYMHEVYMPAKFQGETYILKAAIEEFPLPNGDTGKRLYNLQSINPNKIAASDIGFKDKSQLARSFQSDDTISISHLFSLVNTFDKNFYKNLESPQREDKIQSEVVELAAKFEENVKNVFSSEKYYQYLDTMAKFPDYSARNNMLIYLQNPESTYVCGFNKWKELGRTVNKGEHGLQILAPNVKMVEKVDERGNTMLDNSGKPVKEPIVTGFRRTYVFDVSQTSGKDLPTIAEKLTGEVGEFNKYFTALKSVSPVPIEVENILGGANGYYSYSEQRIAVKAGLSEQHTLKTTVHEIAHAILHNKSDGEEKEADKHTKEVQAESVAYIVCKHYGIDTAQYSEGYVANWSSDKSASELTASLDVIRNTSLKLIEKIDGKLQELNIEKEITPQQQQEILNRFAEKHGLQKLMLETETPLGTTVFMTEHIVDPVTNKKLNFQFNKIGETLKDVQLTASGLQQMLDDYTEKTLEKALDRRNVVVCDKWKFNVEKANYNLRRPDKAVVKDISKVKKNAPENAKTNKDIKPPNKDVPDRE